MKVIGGAGGSLNHHRFTPRAAGQDRKQAAQERQEAAKAAKKERLEADKAAGIHQAKQAARKELTEKRQAAEKDFIGAVAEHMGWDQSALEFPHDEFQHLSDNARTKLERKHHRELLSRARKVAGQQRDWLVADAVARSDAGLGELPLSSDDPEKLSVADLDPVKPGGATLGFDADYKGRAAAAGLTPEAAQKEASAIKLQSMTDEQRKAAMQRGEGAKLIATELANVSAPILPEVKAKLDDAKKATAILAAQKKLSSIHRQLSEMKKEVDKAGAEPKVGDLVVDGDAKLADDVAKSIEDDLKTVATRSFIERVKEAGGRDDMAGHVGVGSYNALNSVALAVGGEALVDRSVVDVLGISGAAAVMARRLRADLSPDDFEHVKEAVREFHSSTHADTSKEAIKAADEAMAALDGLDVSAAVDLSEAAAINAKRKAAIEAARTALGTALGEMEANAALVAELTGSGTSELSVPMGNQTIDSIVQQARAIGLKKGDYKVEKVGSDTFLSVTSDGMDRLAAPIDREGFLQVQRNMDIMSGKHDEDGWLPLGFANRPDLAMDIKPGTAPTIAEPFQPGEDLAESLRDYIGGRAADGDPPADILADIQSLDFFLKAHDQNAYRAALDEVAPLKGADGKMQRVEALAGKFDEYADAFVAKRYGGTLSPLNRQKVTVDDTAVEALHRALSANPEGIAAYKQIGELTSQDQRALRDTFYREIAKESPEQAELRSKLEAHIANEPEKESLDIFGEMSTAPEWTDWKQQRDDLAEQVNASGLDWQRYVKTMGGLPAAYSAIQDVIKSKVSRSFADEHNKMRPDSPLKIGRQVIRGNLNHLDAIDPEARDARLKKDKELIDSLRNRAEGKYAAGSVSDKINAAKEQQAAFEQSQMSLFSTEDMFDGDEAEQQVDKPLASDERYTIGHEAERQIAGLMSVVGQNFKPGQPTKLWNASMNGKFIAQQRAVKLITANKRVGLAFGAGSGKTGIMLGAHSHLSGLGKVKRSIMLVPSIVQGQFHGEALRYLQPGKFKWHAQPGASRDERIAAYKDPDTHFCVMTHQSFRDDMIHLGASHAGIQESEMVQQLSGMSPDERRQWMAGVMEKEGINFDATMVDEAHETVNRAGKENSSLANVVDALSDHTPYYVYASGDPVKNDASEAADVMSKLDRNRYGDKAAFMRRYGVNTQASKDALKREMARYVYSQSITPDIARDRQVHRVDLSPGQQVALKELDGHFAKARLARMQGKVDIDAVRAISPQSFDGVPDDQHEAIAEQLQKSLGIMKSSSIRRVINDHPENAKVDHISKLAAERKGKQGVVFAHSRAAVDAIRARLESEGHRVVTITGSDSSADKDKKRKMFNPESGEAKADILVASDAAAVGMNLQSGAWLVQHDTPDTAKNHGQRNARIDRIGQNKSIELIDLVANHQEEDRARDRLSKKYNLRELMLSPMETLDDTGFAWFLKQRKAQAESAQMGLF